MKEHKRRLNNLEQGAIIRAPEKPFLIITQDRSDPDLYHGKRDYQRDEFEELSKRYRIICIDYSKNWRETVG